MRKYVLLLLVIIIFIGGFFLMDQRKKDETKEQSSNEEKVEENPSQKPRFIKKEQAKQTLHRRKLPEKYKKSLQFHLEENKEASTQKFIFTVENVSDQKVSLYFGTSQRYDYKIYDENRELVYH